LAGWVEAEEEEEGGGGEGRVELKGWNGGRRITLGVAVAVVVVVGSSGGGTVGMVGVVVVEEEGGRGERARLRDLNLPKNC